MILHRETFAEYRTSYFVGFPIFLCGKSKITGNAAKSFSNPLDRPTKLF